MSGVRVLSSKDATRRPATPAVTSPGAPSSRNDVKHSSAMSSSSAVKMLTSSSPRSPVAPLTTATRGAATEKSMTSSDANKVVVSGRGVRPISATGEPKNRPLPSSSGSGLASTGRQPTVKPPDSSRASTNKPTASTPPRNQITSSASASNRAKVPSAAPTSSLASRAAAKLAAAAVKPIAARLQNGKARDSNGTATTTQDGGINSYSSQSAARPLSVGHQRPLSGVSGQSAAYDNTGVNGERPRRSATPADAAKRSETKQPVDGELQLTNGVNGNGERGKEGGRVVVRSPPDSAATVGGLSAPHAVGQQEASAVPHSYRRHSNANGVVAAIAESKYIIAQSSSIPENGTASAAALIEPDIPSFERPNGAASVGIVGSELMSSSRPLDEPLNDVGSGRAESSQSNPAAASDVDIWFAEEAIDENPNTRVNEVGDISSAASCSSLVDDDSYSGGSSNGAVHDSSGGSVVTSPTSDPPNGNYFTVTACDLDCASASSAESPSSGNSSDSKYSLCNIVGGGGDVAVEARRTGGDGSEACVGSGSLGDVDDRSKNVEVERRICKIASELKVRDSLTFYTKHINDVEVSPSKPSSAEGDSGERALRIEKTCDRLTRENSALSDLLAAKKLECVETRQRYRTRIKDLEDDLGRVKMEKCRLLDRLQLPESERASLSVEENALNELRRRLEESEDRLEAARSENGELKRDLCDAELAMQELHDQFQAEESIELRELQRELENTSRDCRLLHFKLRKAERRNEHLQGECDELHVTVNAISQRSNEDRRKLKLLEQELETAKDVSIRLHDECERLQAAHKALKHKTSHDTSSLCLSEASSNRSSMSRSPIDGQGQLIIDEPNGNSGDAIYHVITTPHRHKKRYDSDNVTSSSPKFGSHGDEEVEHMKERDELDLENQLMQADREIANLRRHVTELSKENDDLMKAVSYLRSKLESSTAAKRVSDTCPSPSNRKLVIGNGSCHETNSDVTADSDAVTHSSSPEGDDDVIPLNCRHVTGGGFVNVRDSSLGVSTAVSSVDRFTQTEVDFETS